MTVKVKPTLFIGFGGTGKVVLDTIRAHIVESLDDKKRKLPGCFAFLKFDADPMEEGRARNIGGGTPPADFLECKIPPFSKIDSLITQSTDKSYQLIEKWWPKGLGNEVAKAISPSMDPGNAFQVRFIGRSALFLYLDTEDGFRVRVEKAIDGIRRIPMINAMRRRFPHLEVATDGFEVYVVSSIAGGTGAGMLIDGLAVLRHLLNSQGLEGQSAVSTFLLMPKLYTGIGKNFSLEVARCNAYAVVRELDNLIVHESDDEAVIVDYGFDQIDLRGRLSNYIYLLDDDNESGLGLGGRDEIMGRVAKFVYQMSIGLNRMANQGMGRIHHVMGTLGLARGEGSPKVSQAYSSMGIAEVCYPRQKFAAYAARYLNQCLLGLLEKQGLADNSEECVEAVKRVLDAGGSGLDASWYSRLLPPLEDPDSGFLGANSGTYKEFPRKTLLGTIERSYNTEKARIDDYFNRLSRRVVSESHIEGRTRDFLDSALRRFILDPTVGIAAAKNLVEELLTARLEAQKEAHEKDAEELRGRLLTRQLTKSDQYKNIPRVILWSKREIMLKGLLEALQDDIRNRIDYHKARIRAEVCGLLWEKCVLRRKEAMESLSHEIKRSLGAARIEAQILKNEMLSAPANWVGCDETRIEDIREKVKRLAAENVNLLRKAIADQLKLEDEDLARISEELLVQLHIEDRNVLTEIAGPEGDIREFLVDLARKDASPLWSYKGVDGKGQIERILSSGFSREDIHKFTAGQGIPGFNENPWRHPFADDCHLWVVSLRDGAPANAIGGMEVCYKTYKAKKGTVGVKGTDLAVPASILTGPGTDNWNELFLEKKPEMDVVAYRKLCKKIGLLKKDPNSNFYSLILSEEKTVRSNGIRQVNEAIAEHEGEVKDALTKAIVSEFAPKPDDFLSWGRKNGVPEEIAAQVRRRLALD